MFKLQSHDTHVAVSAAGHQGLTANWFEKGLHVQGQMEVEAEYDSNLLRRWQPEFERLPDNPVYVNNNGDVIR